MHLNLTVSPSSLLFNMLPTYNKIMASVCKVYLQGCFHHSSKGPFQFPIQWVLEAIHLHPTFFIIGTDAQLNINLWKCVVRKEVTFQLHCHLLICCHMCILHSLTQSHGVCIIYNLKKYGFNGAQFDCKCFTLI